MTTSPPEKLARVAEMLISAPLARHRRSLIGLAGEASLKATETAWTFLHAPPTDPARA